MLIYINEDTSSKRLYDNYINYYDYIKYKAHEDEDIKFNAIMQQLLISVTEKNYKLATDKIESIMNKNESKIFIPTGLVLYASDPFSSGLRYSMKSFINVNDIVSYWPSEIDFDKQKEKIGFLLSLNH